jgi:pimeloyl-ACP methyl ester carboxylesterase
LQKQYLKQWGWELLIATGMFCTWTVHAQSPVALEDCRLESSFGHGAIAARCGWFDVAEDRASPAGKHIRIHVAVVRALRKQALPDPIFVVAGGPGQAASDFYLSSSAVFERLRRDRDLVVIDQRGTGKSQRLECAVPDDVETARFDRQLLLRSMSDCLAKLHNDPRFYTTSVAVRDLDEIRAALGYQQINLYGISYGTRVVQHYLRRYPKQVRSIVLDGVVPVETILGPEIAPAAQKSLDAILTRCDQQPSCRLAFPNIRDEFEALRARLRRESESVSLPDPRTAIVSSMEFGGAHLAVAVRLLSYSDDTAALLPFLIHEAAHDRPQPLAAQALMVARRIGDQMANGMHNAVVCTEDVPFIGEENLRDPAIANSYLGSVFTEALRVSCSVWPAGVIDKDFHAKLQSDIPALLLSGENDPVTPVAFGELALQSFPHGRHVVFSGQGHGQLSSYCGISLITLFVERLSLNKTDTECVTHVHAAPFMLDANGPAP